MNLTVMNIITACYHRFLCIECTISHVIKLLFEMVTSWFSVCPVGTEYHGCSWNLSCSDITGVRRCKEQSPCTSGCFCSDGTVLQDGMCSNISSCTGIYICIYKPMNITLSSICVICTCILAWI